MLTSRIENMDLVALQIFRTVAECGGISRAAVRLHRVQSNVTTRIKQLESRLGTRLFHRRNRRLVLSEEGRVLLGYAERLLQLSAEAEAALRNTMPRGALRLGSLESTAATRLPRLLAAYHRAWPEVGVELATGTPAPSSSACCGATWRRPSWPSRSPRRGSIRCTRSPRSWC